MNPMNPMNPINPISTPQIALDKLSNDTLLDVKSRKDRLKSLHKTILKRKSELADALEKDLGKPLTESYLSEVFTILSDIRYVRRHLNKWARAHKVPTPLPLIGTTSMVRIQPKGKVLIIAPWNYPFILTLGPLISAIAAGNAVVLKPSEFAPACSHLLKDIISSIFSESEVRVIEGDAEISKRLVELEFDHIFFTGSNRVGREVAKVAGKNLVPVTLEMGGKSPAVVDNSANLKIAAKRIAWAKLFNNGQTCIAPDYVVVTERNKDRFIDLLLGEIDKLSSNSIDRVGPSRVVDLRHFERLDELVELSKRNGAKVLREKERNKSTLEFPLTVVELENLDDGLMKEEIFGPVLPILVFSSEEKLFKYFNESDPPLVYYVFSRSKRLIRKLIRNTRSGAVSVNHALTYFTNPSLPFGGVRQSGIGRSHGYFGFLQFSLMRSIHKQEIRWNATDYFIPPFTSLKMRLIHFILRWL